MSRVHFIDKEKAVKNASKHDKPTDLFLYRCYRVGDTLYVPHYTERYFVGPGYPLVTNRVYTNIELLATGAKQENRLLLKRQEHKEVGHHE